MAFKLIKVCKELNIGIGTLISWCEKNGFEIESDPNTLIDYELYCKLEEAFSPMQSKPKNEVKIVGKIDFSTLDKDSQRPRFYHPGIKSQRKSVDEKTEKLLEDIPWSCGVVSLFAGHEFGLIKTRDNRDSFYHPNNCDIEGILDWDFVIFKPFFDNKKGKYTAYHIHKPNANDGYHLICDYFWKDLKILNAREMLQLKAALCAYSEKNWNEPNCFTNVLTDLAPYLLACKNDQIFYNRFISIISFSNTEEMSELKMTANLLKQLSESIFPNLNQDCLISLFIRFRDEYKELLFSNIELLSEENKKKFIRSYFVWDCIETAKILISLENEVHLDPALAQKCLYEKFQNIDEISKARLYFMGFDKTLYETLSETTIIQYLVVYENTNICRHYSENIIGHELIIAACCDILKNASSLGKNKVLSYIDIWSSEMPDLLSKVKERLASDIDEKTMRLWEYGILNIPTNEKWTRLLYDNPDAISTLYSLFKKNVIDRNETISIIREWYILEVEIGIAQNDKKGLFEFDQSFYQKFRKKRIDTKLLWECSDSFPVIEWVDIIDNNAYVLVEDCMVDYDLLTKYFYQFAEEEQVKIFKYLFHLSEVGLFELSIEKLIYLSTRYQRKISEDNNIHVCFSIDLVIDALEKYSKHKLFLVEGEIIQLALNTLENVDFRDQKHTMIGHFFDLCRGLEWRKYVEDKDGKRVISHNYKRRWTVFCEGREMAKKDEMGETRYLCRNSYCYGCQVRSHTDWRDFVLYDFCRILHFDLKENDGGGFYCDDGKYLKFMALLNRAVQFMDHLFCRECGRLMKPSDGLSKLASSVSTHFECYNPNCQEKGKQYYLSHCLNTDCVGPIDERDSKRCPNGLIICPRCASCCSSNVFERRYKNLKDNGYPIPLWLKSAIDEKKGHAEKNEYYCSKCGSILEPVIGTQDVDYTCSNPSCKSAYLIGEFHKRKYTMQM